MDAPTINASRESETLRSEMKEISIKYLARIWNVPFNTAKQRILRHSNLLEIRLSGKENGGSRRMISIESLRSSGLLRHGYVENSEGNRLLASSIIRKSFDRLSQSEEELLIKIDPLWQQSTQTKVIEAFCSLFGVSRAWLYRDHSADRHLEKSDTWNEMGAGQKEVVVKIFTSHRNRRVFIEDCMSRENLPVVSERTWYRIAQKLSRDYQDELLLMRKGQVALRQATEPILRDRTHLKPLEVIVGDSTPSDLPAIWINGEVVRPAITFWVDMRTDMIVGRAIGLYDNSLTIKTALFDCLIHYGVPSICYMDNGKPFKAARIVGHKYEEMDVRISWADDVESDLRKFETKGVLPALGIRRLHAIRKNPRAKTVERVFGRGGLSDWMKNYSDYLGNNYWNRPEGVQQAIVEHRKARKHGAKGGILINKKTGEVIQIRTIEELAWILDRFIEWHNNRTSEGFGMDGKSPLEIYQALTQKDPPKKIDALKLAWSFLEGPDRPKHISRTTGHILFKKDIFYRADKFWNHRGEDVLLKYNPLDRKWWHRADGNQHEYVPREIYVYDIKGIFIDIAHMVERAMPIDDPNIADRLAMTQRTYHEAVESVKELRANGNTPLNPLSRGDLATVVNVNTMTEEILKAEEKRRELNRQKGPRRLTHEQLMKENCTTEEEINGIFKGKE